jgi:hypothetical protein
MSGSVSVALIASARESTDSASGDCRRLGGDDVPERVVLAELAVGFAVGLEHAGEGGAYVVVPDRVDELLEGACRVSDPPERDLTTVEPDRHRSLVGKSWHGLTRHPSAPPLVV